MKGALLIDDDPVVRDALARYLERQGWKVWEAGDGESGLRLAREHLPAVIISDLLMPRLNGFQLFANIRSEPALRRARLVSISSKTYPEDREAALTSGADAFLSKPVNLGELLALLDGWVASIPPTTQAATATRTPGARGLRARFWGVRGSIPTPGPATLHYGGNTSCVEVRAGNEIIILDAGTGIRPLGLALADEFKDRPLNLTLLISHTHWDHIQGFPFFQPAYDPRNRIRILGYEGARQGLANVLSSQMEGPYFPIGLKELPGHIEIQELKEMRCRLGDVEVQAAFANHPGVCVGYRLQTDAGSLVYLPDNEPFAPLPDRPKTASLPHLEAAAFAQAEAAKLVEFIHGADALIMDAQYDAAEYQAHRGWGHGCVDDVVALAGRARVKRLFLFHHAPEHDDGKVWRMLEHARQLAQAQRTELVVEAAREGDEIALPASCGNLR